MKENFQPTQKRNRNKNLFINALLTFMILSFSSCEIIGGIFKTIGEAYEHNKKVIKAGQPDAFVTAIYKGKRIYLEELEKIGIFKK